MPPDARQRVEQAGEMAALAALADFQDIRVVAILPSASSIASHGLQRRIFVGGIDDIDVGRRHRQARQPVDDAWITDSASILTMIAEAPAADAPADG